MPPYNLNDLELVDHTDGVATFRYPDGQTMQVPTYGLSNNFLGQFNSQPNQSYVDQPQTTYGSPQVPIIPTPEPTPVPTPQRPLAPEIVAGLQGYDVPNPKPVNTKRFSLRPASPTQPESTEKTPLLIPPPSQNLIDQGYKNRMEAAKNLGAIDASGKAQISDTTNEALNNVAGMNLDMQAQQNAYDEQVNHFMKSQEEAQNTIKGMKVDPGRKFKEIGTWGKIGAAIAVMANALGNALQGVVGPNQSMNIILDSIDKDIDLQEREIDKAKGDLNTDMNMLSRYMGIFKDRLEAKKMLRADYIDMVNMRLDALDKKVSSEKAKYAIQDSIGQLQIAQQKDRNDALESAMKRGAMAAEIAGKNQIQKQDPKAGIKASMLDAEQSIQYLKAKGTSGPGLNPLYDDSGEKSFKSASDQWIQDYLQATGRRPTKETIELTKSAFIPKPLDSAEVIAEKQRRRQKAMMNIGSAPSTAQEVPNEEEGF